MAKEAGLPPQTYRDDTTPPDSYPRLQHSPHLLPVNPRRSQSTYNLRPHSHPSLPSFRDRAKFQRHQSLRNDPTTESLVRRISSRKRKDKDHDQARENEVRAMSLAMPQKRPAGSAGGGMLRRESKKVKGGSDVSLPFQDSIHSSMSGNSERRAFRVSAFDMFSPRPTIRCSVDPRHSTDRSSPNAYNEKSESRRERKSISAREQNQSRRTSRIDDLADSLDAGALREIMERDKRRRDKKAKADTERLRRKLERRAERDRSVEASGRPITPRREVVNPFVGLGIESDASAPMEDVQPSTPRQPQRTQVPPMTPTTQENSQLPTPLDSPMEEPVVSDAKAIRYSRGSVSVPGHNRGPSNVSQLPELISERFAQETPIQSIEQPQDPTRSGSLHAIDTAETASPSRRASIRRRSSDIRRMGVIASLFRRGKRGSQDQGRTSPSEVSFSNTSRESMSRQPLPAHFIGPSPGPAPITTPPAAPVLVRKPASVPRRTKSKFREDLPEYPVSPPDSRLQSPEAAITSAIAARRRTQTPPNLQLDAANSPASNRSYSPTSPMPPVGNIMSQSLASVDSEASWLSGKPVKRASTKSYIRSSNGSTAVQPHYEHSHSYEELGMADEEYFRRLTPQPEDPISSTRSSDVFGAKSNGILGVPGSSEEDQPVQQVKGRQPTIVHREPRVISNEGVVGSVHERTTSTEETSPKLIEIEPETPEPETPASETEFSTVQRAQSVDLGKHHHGRHLSAGSAKLLDIRRTSTNSHSNILEQGN